MSLENILSNHFNFRRKPLATINFSHLYNFIIQHLFKKFQIRLKSAKVCYQIWSSKIIFLGNHCHYFLKALATRNIYDENLHEWYRIVKRRESFLAHLIICQFGLKMVIALAKYFELIHEFTPSLMIFQQQIWLQLDIYRYFNMWPDQWAPMPMTGVFYATQDTQDCEALNSGIQTFHWSIIFEA